MNNFAVRMLFALGVGMPLFVFLMWFGYSTRFIAISLIMVVGAWEYARMIHVKEGGPKLTLFTPAVVLGFMILQGVEGLSLWMPFYCIFVLLSYILIAFKWVQVKKLFPWMAIHLFAPVFFGLWGSLGFDLFSTEAGFDGSLKFLFVMMCMWACDSWAYFFGRAFGKHKLCPGISPKKTWEGAFGGVLCTIIWAWITKDMIGLEGPVLYGLAFILAIAAMIGDLLMSTAKRYTGVKDSSNIFPGHGGMLDRFDSFYLAGPIAVIVLRTLA